MAQQKLKKNKNNKELNQYIEVLEKCVVVIEINYKILEDKLSRLNELFNNSKVDTQTLSCSEIYL